MYVDVFSSEVRIGGATGEGRPLKFVLVMYSPVTHPERHAEIYYNKEKNS